MKSGSFFAMLLVFAYSLTFAGFAAAKERAGTPAPVQEGRKMRLYLDVAIPSAVREYFDRMHMTKFIPLQKYGQSLFAISGMPNKDDDPGLLGMTAVFCADTQFGLNSADVHLRHLASVYLYRENPLDPSQRKVETIYYDKDAPCIKNAKK